MEIKLSFFGSEEQPFQEYSIATVQKDSIPLKPGQKRSFQPAIPINNQENEPLKEIILTIMNLQ